VTTQNLAKAAAGKKDASLERYVLRFGESLEQVAAARGVPVAKLIELNAVAPGEVLRGGTVLLVPRKADVKDTNAKEPKDPAAPQQVVAIPADIFVYPDRRRVFYRVLVGDTLREISTTFHVSVDELRRWNDIDPTARLQEGMTLQVFVPGDTDLSTAVVLRESEVKVVTVGSDDFFTYHEGLKGKRRVSVTCKHGDTLEGIGRRYGVSTATMERINRKSRSETLKEGDTVHVYVPSPSSTPAPTSSPSATSASAVPVVPPLPNFPIPAPNGPLPTAPSPDALPPL
jgi:membrane-bound lytic murein transglycosylase D